MCTIAEGPRNLRFEDPCKGVIVSDCVRKRERRRCSGIYSANNEVNQKRRYGYKILKLLHLKPCNNCHRPLHQIQTPQTASRCLSNLRKYWSLLFQPGITCTPHGTKSSQVFLKASKGSGGRKKLLPSQKELIIQVVKSGSYLQTLSKSAIKSSLKLVAGLQT